MVDLSAVAAPALQQAADRSGLDPRGARLIRLFGTAVYHLPAVCAVARIALVTSPDIVTRLTTSIAVTQWLAGIGFPAVEPLPVDQPVISHDCAVTFWRNLSQHGPEPSPADLGHLLRRLHQLEPPPVRLPSYRPLASMPRRIEASSAISDDDRAWLLDRCVQARPRLQPAQLPAPDRDDPRRRLARQPAPRPEPRRPRRLGRRQHRSPQTDLIPIFQAPRFGLPDRQRDAFIAAYGHDIRSWDGYPILRKIRELSTLRALLRDGHADPAALRELHIRLRSLRTGDDRRWTAF